jgi:hypothetical protein
MPDSGEGMIVGEDWVKGVPFECAGILCGVFKWGRGGVENWGIGLKGAITITRSAFEERRALEVFAFPKCNNSSTPIISIRASRHDGTHTSCS